MFVGTVENSGDAASTAEPQFSEYTHFQLLVLTAHKLTPLKVNSLLRH